MKEEFTNYEWRASLDVNNTSRARSTIRLVIFCTEESVQIALRTVFPIHSEEANIKVQEVQVFGGLQDSFECV